MQSKPQGCVPDSWRGRAILMFSHFSGMIDLVALPVWVAVLVQHYGFDLEHAGMIVTAFLTGAVAASLFAAPRFNRLPRRACAIAGFATASVAFLAAAHAASFGALVLLHLTAGVAVGTALSVTHGTIGRSINPHKLFAVVGTALGIGAVVFYAAVPPVVAVHGGSILFKVFAGLMAFTAVAALGFPQVASLTASSAAGAPLSRATWFAISGVSCMALNQALTFSMLDRIGIMHSFSQAQVNQVLVACGLVNLLPAPIAGLLHKRLNPAYVAQIAAPLQAALAIAISQATGYAQYAVAASMYAAVLIFTHTFLFGLIARLDPSGRALASTPAMMMTGSAIGPALAGAVAMRAGFNGLSVMALGVGAAATLFFMLAARRAAEPAEAANVSTVL